MCFFFRDVNVFFFFGDANVLIWGDVNVFLLRDVNVFLLRGCKHLFALGIYPKLYIPSPPNTANETPTFMGLGRTGCFGQL